MSRDALDRLLQSAELSACVTPEEKLLKAERIEDLLEVIEDKLS
jgi:hypothetical protein